MNNFRGNDRGRPGGGQGHPGGGSSWRSANDGPSQELQDLLKKVDLAEPSADMFDGVAEKIAKELSSDGLNKNKPAQVRKFYDEIVRYSDRHRGTARPDEDKSLFERDLPFIRMICARAAYAKTREHVDGNFVAFMQDGLRKIGTAEELHRFRDLFEAVIGFSPKGQGHGG
jgi:CRISPR-associated protein Csm2